MKSLKESLFDKDLVQKDVKVISLLDLIKGKVRSIYLSGIPLFKMFPGNFIMQMKRDYNDIVIPTKRYKSKYEKNYGILNPFLNYILDNTYLDSGNYKNNNIHPKELNKELNTVSKIPVKVSFYRHDLNDEISAIVLHVSYGDDFVTTRLELDDASLKDYFALFKNVNESIFNKDIVEKDIKFGDMYKPVWISSTNSDNPFKKITNMFNMGELRRAAKDKKLDLSGVQQNSYYDNRYLETIEMIAGLVADFPYDPKSYSYDSKITDTFKPLARQPYWRRGISVSILGSHGAVCDNGDGILELHITKSNRMEYINIVIKFEKK